MHVTVLTCTCTALHCSQDPSNEKLVSVKLSKPPSDDNMLLKGAKSLTKIGSMAASKIRKVGKDGEVVQEKVRVGQQDGMPNEVGEKSRMEQGRETESLG